jgi:hypothetical protein
MFHTIKSSDRLAGTASNYKFELTIPINDITSIELVSATIPTAVTSNYYIRIAQFNGHVLNHNGSLNYSTFIVPHHHYGNPASDTEYTVNYGFVQRVDCDPHISVNYLDVILADDTGNPIAGALDWDMVLYIKQNR